MEKTSRPFLSQIKSLTSSSALRLQIIFLFIGIILVVLGLLYRSRPVLSSGSVKVLDEKTNETGQLTDQNTIFTVDISGAVKTPGIYELKIGSRVDDVIDSAGGFADDVDEEWVDKNLNRAAKILDGQKLYIPPIQQSNVLSASNISDKTNVAQLDNGLININKATLSEIETLPGIGQVYGQKIIEGRPYSDSSEILSKGVLKESLYTKIKDKITVY